MAASLVRNLHLPLKETPLLFTENSIHNKELRLKLTEFLFERLEAPQVFLCKDSVLSSFACGRSTAIVLDSGALYTTATPVHDGYALQKCTLRNNIGGTTITERLFNWLSESKVEVKPRFTFKSKFTCVDGVENFTTTPIEVSNCDPGYYKYSQMQIVKDIKEEFLFVAEEPLTGLGAAQQIRAQAVVLPDGTQCQIGGERASIVEKMFSTNDELEGFTGVQQMVVDSIGKTDIDIRRDLYQNIIITGGNTCFKGFMERLQKQVPDVAPQNVKVKVISAAEKRFTPWVGGSILSSCGSFQQMWMSR